MTSQDSPTPTPVGIVTDSVSCIPPEVVSRLGIEIVPVELVFDGKVYRDGVDITPDEFYALLEGAKRLPTTSAVSPGSYLQIYRRVAERGKDVLCITVTSRLSAMYDSAKTAADMAREVLPDRRVEVLDSGTATTGEGFMVMEAARAAASGKGLDEARSAALRIQPWVYVLAMLDTLHYLARGGRVPKAAAWATSLLQVKPILEVKDGEVHLFERVRTRKRATEHMLQAVARLRRGKGPLHAAVMHAHTPREAEELGRVLAARFQPAELYVTQFTPVMGVHTGPGVLGVAFYWEEG
ncbi:MAG: DegV family protein [Chloroflexota bacterium]